MKKGRPLSKARLSTGLGGFTPCISRLQKKTRPTTATVVFLPIRLPSHRPTASATWDREPMISSIFSRCPVSIYGRCFPLDRPPWETPLIRVFPSSPDSRFLSVRTFWKRKNFWKRRTFRIYRNLIRIMWNMKKSRHTKPLF